MSGINGTRFEVQHESCECKCGLNESICNSNQNWDPGESWCECKELDNWGYCKNDYIWNPGSCDFGCNQSCKTDKYLDVKNCSYENRLLGKLVLECQDKILNTFERSFDDTK